MDVLDSLLSEEHTDIWNTVTSFNVVYFVLFVCDEEIAISNFFDIEPE